mmetsp:Transcript_81777/g.243898  ORF Transcript_81777/g.243898 Transcript_81777/m.243898 type:complete len:404 (-) Transcript_81777:209-1420(-)
MRYARALFGRIPSHVASFVAGAAAGTGAYAAVGNTWYDGEAKASPTADAMARAERKLRKLQQSAQERIHWPALDQEVLGLMPRLWMEVLDPHHRYATLLHHYYRRWQLSDTRDDFFHWLDHGQGSLIDHPHAPKRLLDEWRVIYLGRDEQPNFLVRIEPETGRFVWQVDGTPVTLPLPPLPCREDATPRELAVEALLKPALEKASQRDGLLADALAEARRRQLAGEEPTREHLERLSEPLVREGLLCRLRDPHFEERLDAAPTPEGHAHLRELAEIPETLLEGLTWDDFVKAISHDQGKLMKTPFESGDARAKGKGIFVLSSFGLLYCGTKIRGIFHHSSFVRGHCVKVAGGITIVDGWLKELSSHSGHYQPGQQQVDDMIVDWKARGVDFSGVVVKPYMKEK